MKLPFIRKKEPAVNDPLRHANRPGQKLRSPYHLRAEWNSLQPVMPRHTTGEFARAGGRSYDSHCTPTAITNLLCLYETKGLAPRLSSLPPEELFLRVTRLGRQTLLYWNMRLFGRFGGTSIFLTGLYLRLCLWKFRIKPSPIRPHLPGSRDRLLHALTEGNPVLLSVLGHRVYGSHSLIAYGMVLLQNEQGKDRYYLTVADGWASRPRYVPLDSLHFFAFWELTGLSR